MAAVVPPTETPILAVSGSLIEAPERISTNRKVCEWIQDEWELRSSWKAVAAVVTGVVLFPLTLVAAIFGSIPAWNREVDPNPDLFNIRAVESAAERVLLKGPLSRLVKKYAENPVDPNEIKAIQGKLRERFAECKTAKEISDLLDQLHKVIDAHAQEGTKRVASGKLKLIKNAVFDEIITPSFFQEVASNYQEALYGELAGQDEEAALSRLFTQEVGDTFIRRARLQLGSVPLMAAFEKQIETLTPFEDWRKMKGHFRELSKNLLAIQVPQEVVNGFLKAARISMQGQFVNFIALQIAMGSTENCVKKLLKLDVLIAGDIKKFEEAVERRKKEFLLFARNEAFTSRFDQYKNPDPALVDGRTKTFSPVDEIERNTEGMRAPFASYANRADKDGVIEQPRDGNCWLHTSLVGLRLLNHRAGTDHTHETLRQEAIDWIEEQGDRDRTLNRLITDSIGAHKSVEQKNLQDQIDSLSTALAFGTIKADQVPEVNQTIEQNQNSLEALNRFTRKDYLRHMRIVGSHGSHAEWYAISRMFEVNIVIWRDVPAAGEQPRRLTNEYDEQIEFPDSKQTIHAVLTQAGNHFNYRLPPSDQRQ